MAAVCQPVCNARLSDETAIIRVDFAPKAFGVRGLQTGWSVGEATGLSRRSLAKEDGEGRVPLLQPFSSHEIREKSRKFQG